MIIGFYGQAIEDTVPVCMVPCDEQRTKREDPFGSGIGKGVEPLCLEQSQRLFILS
jgi:hypothetical protein